MTLSINEVKKGSLLLIEADPYVVLESKHSHIGRGGAVLQTRIKNIKTGAILDRNFRSGESLKEAEIRKMPAKFIYERRGEYWFHEKDKPANRFSIETEALKDKAALLKPEMEVTALKFVQDDREEIINIELPIKADYKVTHAPPGIRGNTAQGGTKVVTIEGGLKVNVPLFIEEGDTVRINTDSQEYAERV